MVIVVDLKQPKLDIVEKFGAVRTVNIEKENPLDVVQVITEGWGADIVFEASGSEQAAKLIFDLLCPGGRVVYIGMPAKGIVPIDIVGAQIKEASIETIFRYAHVYPRALNLMGAGKIDVKPLITETYPFDDAVKAIEYGCNPKPTSVKIQITLP